MNSNHSNPGIDSKPDTNGHLSSVEDSLHAMDFVSHKVCASEEIVQLSVFNLLADRTYYGRTYATLLHLSVCRLLRIVAKWCVLEQKLL